MSHYIVPHWQVPANVRAASTLRSGGASPAPFDSFNLGAHVGDDPRHVDANRSQLRRELGLPSEPHWLQQVHGTRVVRLSRESERDPETVAGADAAWTDQPGQVCAVLTADCLPVVFASRDGKRVGVAHAGWRGLSAGVLEATVASMGGRGEELIAWLGPAIEQEHFEVGGEVREAFVRNDPVAADAFQSRPKGRWLADLFALARQRLQAVKVRDVSGGGRGTYADRASFFSHRRDGRCGRMATLAWLE